MSALAAALRALAARTGHGCHRCGLLPSSAPTRALAGRSYPHTDLASVLLERDGRLRRCRDRSACDRRRLTLA